MPRGNDSVTIDRENQARFGEHLNADELIRANNAQYDPALQRVLGTATNEEETEKVTADLPSWESKFNLRDGESLLAAAVHGHALVGVIEMPDGRHRKAVIGYTESYVEPTLNPGEKAQVERAKVEGEVAAETQRIRDERDRRVREAAAEAEREEQEAIAQIRADADERIKQAREEAEAAAADAEAKPAAKPKPAAAKSKS